MWKSTDSIVENYLKNESTIRSKSLIVAEWNLNNIDNVDELGNYRYRPNSQSGDSDYIFNSIPTSFTKETSLSSTKYYYGATDSDIVIDGGFDETNTPLIFSSQQTKNKALFSLESCIGRFRPRSGINKVVYFDGKYLNRVHPNMARQPRFYFATPSDRFKYWTSYRTEGKQITLSATVSKVYARQTTNGQYITKIRALSNSFSSGNIVTFNGTGITALDGKSFTVHSASSNYIKIFANITSTDIAIDLSAHPNSIVSGSSAHNFVRGLSYISGSDFVIEDAVPFVTYKNTIPSNRITIKMQTKVGDIDLGPYFTETGKQYNDPFFDTPANKAVPKKWKVQVLNSLNQWVDAYDFESNPYDIPSHGQVELAYGLIVPTTTNNISNLHDIFLMAGKVSSSAGLPVMAPEGYAYLVESTNGPGTFYVAYNQNGKFAGYDTFDAQYSWYLNSSEIPTNITSFVTDFTNPDSYKDLSNNIHYRSFQNIKGIRLFVKTMTVENATFDLIEFSPRLAADITDITQSVSVTKHASDLGSSGMPVGQLLASTGNLEIFDYDQSFNSNNTNSIVSTLSSKNLQVKIYESLFPGNGKVYTIPIKTLYADGFPEINHESRSVTVKLRDLFFYFESMKAPELLIPNCSLSMAVSSLMDSIGFSNYTFKRPAGQTEEAVIPYFFTGPDMTIAQVLEDLAISTQTAMFLDEYNNLVLMSKEYMLPKNELDRPTDFTFIGDNSGLANIVQLQSADDDVYNDGKISYETKYIQRSYSSLSQANYIDADKTWVYKPVLLWEVSPEDTTKSWNDESSKQSSYTLAAIPLSSDLSSDLPKVVNGAIVNNTMDLGEAIYWLSRYNGYFYANGEIIKFDAVQYNIPVQGTTGITGKLLTQTKNNVVSLTGVISLDNKELIQKLSVGKIVYNAGGTFKDGTTIKAIDAVNGTITVDVSNILIQNILSISFSTKEPSNNVWISSVEEYQKYFATLPFGGKIYPTGLVRIYAEPYYDSSTSSGLKEGDVAKHGRGQFNTDVAYHNAGLDPYWRDTNNHKTIYMKYSYMFNGGDIPATYQNVPAGVLNTSSSDPEISAAAQSVSNKATINGVIRNFMSTKNVKEADANNKKSVVPGTIQSSALVIDGPSYPSKYNPLSFVQYVHKPMESKFHHFETRMRIIGEMADERLQTQNPVGSSTYYTVDGKNIGGSSAGIGVWVNPATNCGYYFEIVAITDTSANAYTSTASAINTMFFYKIQADSSGNAIPIVLWSGLAPILCDSGRFTGQERQTQEQNTTVYDVGIEFDSSTTSPKFNLFLNGKMVASVKDKDPLRNGNNVALFVRGSARAMFENLSAVTQNYALAQSQNVDMPVSSAFGITNQTNMNSARRFGLSGAVKNTVLSGIYPDAKGNPSVSPQYSIYYDEFGTIMREASHFNIKYDKAYPALFAKISPTFNNNQGYAISGFTANAFGAEFLLFNTTDTVLSLDSGSGNYLRIQGVTFTQNSRHDLTVDEFFSDKGDLSNPQYRDNKVYNQKYQEQYLDIKKNRITNGIKSFTINAPYIQSQDAANDMMSWLSGKIMKPRKAVGLETLSMPHLQLGDIVTIQYQKDSINQISNESSGRYVIYSIDYTRGNDGPSMVVHLSEVK